MFSPRFIAWHCPDGQAHICACKEIMHKMSLSRRGMQRPCCNSTCEIMSCPIEDMTQKRVLPCTCSYVVALMRNHAIHSTHHVIPVTKSRAYLARDFVSCPLRARLPGIHIAIGIPARLSPDRNDRLHQPVSTLFLPSSFALYKPLSASSNICI